MLYTREFFAFQIEFAHRLSTHFGGTFGDYLFDSTTFSKSIGIGYPNERTNPVWQAYLVGLQSPAQAIDWTYEFYLSHNGQLDGLHPSKRFDSARFFGCFYYELHGATAVRPCFVNNDRSGHKPLSRERLPVRREELKHLFEHIVREHPAVTQIVGSSWLYNLSTYCQLFPPEFTTNLGVNEEDEFQSLARWGQCFDAYWRLKPAIAQTLFARLEALDRLSALATCFPYPVLEAGCPLSDFIAFYEMNEP